MKKLVVIPSDPIAAYEEKGTFTWIEDYYNPDKYFDEVFVLSPLEKEATTKYGLTIIPVSSNRDFKKKLAQINPLYVRAYGGYWASDFAIHNKIKGIPVVCSVHDTNPQLLYGGLKFADYYISMSNAVTELLITQNIARKEEIYTLGNRVNTDLFKEYNKGNSHVKKIKNQFKDKIIILSIGRKSTQKNFETLIPALKHLPENFHLVTLGRGNLKYYKELAIQNEVGERITWIEKIDNNMLPFWYNAADVFCVPSIREGFGLVFIEAASCLSKIVTSDISPMNEYLVNDNEMNFLVKDYQNPSKLAEAILLAYKSNKKNSYTRNFIIDHFSKETIEKKEIIAYQNTRETNKTSSFAYLKWKYRKYSLSNIKMFIRNNLKKIWSKIPLSL